MQSAKIGKYEVLYTDSVEFHALKREIWGSHCYYQELAIDHPHILDLGSHIGLSVLYFKTIFPNAQIDCYEPHPKSYHLLQENINWNRLEGINSHNLAVSTGAKSLTLHTNQDDSWRSTVSIFPGAWNESQQTIPQSYPATPLNSILHNHYDIIKMDVEGYEYELINSVKDKLHLGKVWLIEIHGIGHYDVRELISLFEKEGFSTLLEKGKKVIKPHQLSGLALLRASCVDVK